MKKRHILLPLLASATLAVNAADYNILDFGAARNNLSTAAIQKAIDTCFNRGGGTVIVPEGVFITGTIIPKSNINLLLSSGSELRSSQNLNDFRVGTSRLGMIFCRCVFDNVVISESNMLK